MRRFYIIFILSVVCAGCSQRTGEKAPAVSRVYSTAVNDTFSIFVSLPEDYHKHPGEAYPVVYILDANLYFDVFSVILKKYSEVGLLRSAILVGIGYKDFPTMDSLRNRDYTYPVAIPEYEMSVSGRADNFLTFLSKDLVPAIDSQYQTDKTNRVLMGHSLGGYFTLYALMQQLRANDSLFSGYIAASPSTHYNHYYLLKEFQKLDKDHRNKAMVYFTMGGMEEAETNRETAELKTDSVLSACFKPADKEMATKYKGEIYSNLDHMDTPLPGFVKGMQWVLRQE